MLNCYKNHTIDIEKKPVLVNFFIIFFLVGVSADAFPPIHLTKNTSRSITRQPKMVCGNRDAMLQDRMATTIRTCHQSRHGDQSCVTTPLILLTVVPIS